jgi:1-aminocyclopropane-1-carboxylate synthase
MSGFSMPSSHTQMLMAEMLDDEEWTDSFLRENKERLRRSYRVLSGERGEARSQGGRDEDEG